LSSSSRVLACVSFDPFCRWIFVARSSQTVRTRVLDGSWWGRRSAGPSRRSVIEGAVLEVRDCFSDSPPELADGLPGGRRRSAW
jgi:hypothetical protein